MWPYFDIFNRNYPMWDVFTNITPFRVSCATLNPFIKMSMSCQVGSDCQGTHDMPCQWVFLHSRFLHVVRDQARINALTASQQWTQVLHTRTREHTERERSFAMRLTAPFLGFFLLFNQLTEQSAWHLTCNGLRRTNNTFLTDSHTTKAMLFSCEQNLHVARK